MSSTQTTSPLEQLRDIHPPEVGGFWPPAPGWWVLGVVCLAIIAGATWWLIRRYRQNRWRRLALQELQSLKAQPENFAQLNALLKRAALARFPEARLASLTGEEWAQWLNQTVPGTDQERIRELIRAPWRPDVELPWSEACRIVDQWIRRV